MCWSEANNNWWVLIVCVYIWVEEDIMPDTYLYLQMQYECCSWALVWSPASCCGDVKYKLKFFLWSYDVQLAVELLRKQVGGL